MLYNRFTLKQLKAQNDHAIHAQDESMYISGQ